jgi:hypothetical protein
MSVFRGSSTPSVGAVLSNGERPFVIPTRER